MPNLELLDATIDWAEAHPEGSPDEQGRWHDQNVWIAGPACGTACCLAGHVALAAGWTNAADDGYCYREGLVERDGVQRSVVAVARAELLLSYQQAQALFDGNNTIEVLRRLAKDLHNGEPIDEDLAHEYQGAQ